MGLILTVPSPGLRFTAKPAFQKRCFHQHQSHPGPIAKTKVKVVFNRMEENSAKNIARKIFQAVRIDNKRVLEIGCGAGRITALLAGKSEALTALDPDKDAIAAARRMAPGVDFQIGSG